MSDANKPIDPKDLHRIQKFGLGIGKEYEPFIKVDELSSRGESIREQFPIPVTDTLDICLQLGSRHPQIKGFLKVVTKDLLIDFKYKTQIAVAVKHSSDSGKERVVDKLQIEKAYWEGRGVQ
ncbi:Tn7 transposase TnsA N-terminal domain-containing protein [Pectobacterium sp. FL60-S17]|uniref:Tn7 transposase TnsA N-terminal domain-containing protein n=1 Tax=Pectobacterium quasiaquaticum TaxID=2774015 RepID=A0A9Q2EN13_9GAMM|nr:MULTISPECIES: TnsA endonuclease N-terminal domain-containing protein [Pectobacterium]MBE5203357.1 Tn7 transposase TnsA N-terminal domain-containing protein [Pectobacterium quasiaquaticum]MBE5211449.1 Tn7 transposase TnsA N-terminal domain-containing protein [Pectobacterium quasiaquaticum]MBE5214552.1 Tn7 transposase TnsA N-terminal domain-containing protein [Pectobacterium quasiaquaticum]MBE5222635.1 Tn7 transposase TnsA N-terminal domain-containing protein [Pectobacterium quasiaquaticum]MB